jgi:hypothetical protein
MTEPNSDHLTSASSEGNLLPCPHCGGRAGWWGDVPYCERCNAMGGSESENDTREQTATLWNRRAPAVPPNWQDIATLPTTISKSSGLPWSRWVLVHAANAVYQAMLVDERWIVLGNLDLRIEPTHWMALSLPPPPEAASQPDQGDAA